MRQPDSEKFALLRRCERIWAIASIHGDVQRLTALHDKLSRRVHASDRVVYLGNYMGVGPAVRGVLDELIEFRRWLLARPRAFATDVVFLRGAQEEMWSKLLQLQFAPNPGEVLRWLLDHGTVASLKAYGGDPTFATQVAREGPVSMTRWTTGLRAALAAAPGHQPFLSGLRRAAFTDVDLSGVLQTIVETYTAVAEDHEHGLASHIAEGVTVQGDRQLLTQMIANIVENALRHTPAGTRIEIELTAASAPVCTIRDNGPGIPEPERQKVFRRFYRLDSSRATPGSGLGLSLVAAVAELHRIVVEIGDNQPGLRVTLRFPGA